MRYRWPLAAWALALVASLQADTFANFVRGGSRIRSQRSSHGLQRKSASAAMVTHTRMTIADPWADGFESTWDLPEGAVSGSLLRDGTTFLAVLEWASAADCKAWLNDCEDRRAVTDRFELRSHKKASNAEASRSDASVKSVKDAEVSERAPNVDPAVIFAISAGEQVDIDLEDEVLISGGDPSFLEGNWERPAKATSPISGSDPDAARRKLDTFFAKEDEYEEDDEEDVLFHGGDPTFLDPTAWNSKSTEAELEWDGKEDDYAHFDD